MLSKLYTSWPEQHHKTLDLASKIEESVLPNTYSLGVNEASREIIFLFESEFCELEIEVDGILEKPFFVSFFDSKSLSPTIFSTKDIKAVFKAIQKYHRSVK